MTARSILPLLLLSCAAAPAQNEPWRPLYHFTPAKNWMNDPNGMVFHGGEWHLFYQYNPFGDKWGHMSWGHAVSRNLLTWEHLPLALAEENGVMIFSGSAVVDEKNTSGFGKDGQPPMVAIYTGHTNTNQSQCIAFSTDKGRTWTKYAENPVLDIGDKDFRDPKVMWHQPTKRWVMTVAWPVHRKIRFYASPDLKKWTHLSDFGPAGSVSGIWECPDLLPVSVEGEAKKWLLIVNAGGGAPAGGSGGQYFAGEFDGTTFKAEPQFAGGEGDEFVPEPARVLADFENGYGDWKVEGDCFGDKPSTGRIGGQHPVFGFRGKGLVNTYLQGDTTTGTLTSPEFEIDREWLSFLIGGGAHPGKTCLNLIVDGQTAQTATGPDDEPLRWQAWNVAALRGKKAVLQIVDKEKGGWGHINVDHIILAGAPARSAPPPGLWLDYGPDFYAGVTWSDAPQGDDRRILLGWMSNWPYAGDVPTKPWRSTMSVPREISLRRTSHGLRLVQQPVREIASFSGVTKQFTGGSADEANAWLRAEGISGTALDLKVIFARASAGGEYSVDVLADETKRTRAGLDPARSVLFVDRKQSGKTDFHASFPARAEAPLDSTSGERLTLRVLVDACSVEAFAGDGAAAVTALAFPPPGAKSVRINAGGRISSIEARVFSQDGR